MKMRRDPRAPKNRRLEHDSFPVTLLAKPAMLGLHRAVTARSPRRHDRRRAAAIFRLRFSVQGALRACASRCQRHSGLFWSLTPLIQNAPLRSIPAPASEPLHWPLLPFHSASRSDSSETGNPGAARARTFAPQAPQNSRTRAAPKISLPSAARASRWPFACPAAIQATARVSPDRQKAELRGPAARSRLPARWDLPTRQLALGTGHRYDPRKLRVWAVALLHLLRTHGCYMQLPPRDLPQAQHKSRVPAVPKRTARQLTTPFI
jgi:hypothetical protein